MGEQIILASKSAARRAVLTGAGVPFEVAVAGVDEDAVKTAMLAQGATPRDVADALAEIKAVKISAGRPGFVIGSDQTLEFEGQLYDKAETLEAAAERLKTMRGKPHKLHSAVVVAKDGTPIWREIVSEDSLLSSSRRDAVLRQRSNSCSRMRMRSTKNSVNQSERSLSLRSFPKRLWLQPSG